MGRLEVPNSRRKYAERSRWVRVTKRTFTVKHLNTAAFKGAVTRLELIAVKEPLFKTEFGKRLRIADKGFTWLQHFPEGERYCLTSMFNAKGKVAQWYLDIAYETGRNEEGMPWWDDLYLDIIVVPGKGVKITDQDDLKHAVAKGKVGKKIAKQAREDAERLERLIKKDKFGLLELSKKHFKKFDKL